MEMTVADVFGGKVRCSQCGISLMPGQDTVETMRRGGVVSGAQFMCHACNALTPVDITDGEGWARR